MTSMEPYKDPKRLIHALQGLAIAEILFCALDLSLGLAAGWPMQAAGNEDATLFIGFIAITLVIQILARLASLLVRSRWTFRLVANARRFQALPVSERWAWLGFFIPILSLWIPLTVHQALTSAQTQQQGWTRLLVPAWWLLRLATCLSGTMIIFVVLVLLFYRDGSQFLPLTFVLLPALTGLPCAILSLMVVHTLSRQQAAPDDIRQATVF